ncbi:hypothetical protein AB4151_01645 [Vibrio splendidus]|nr:hypothetical protein [Vibrio splendidus]MDH5894430.1 hypothetical protein [Vibrio splendidus]
MSETNDELGTIMGCCNKAPKGGAPLGLLLKVTLGIGLFVFLLALWQ